jgi:hypothetical protein
MSIALGAIDIRPITVSLVSLTVFCLLAAGMMYQRLHSRKARIWLTAALIAMTLCGLVALVAEGFKK